MQATLERIVADAGKPVKVIFSSNDQELLSKSVGELKLLQEQPCVLDFHLGLSDSDEEPELPFGQEMPSPVAVGRRAMYQALYAGLGSTDFITDLCSKARTRVEVADAIAQLWGDEARSGDIEGVGWVSYKNGETPHLSVGERDITGDELIDLAFDVLMIPRLSEEWCIEQIQAVSKTTEDRLNSEDVRDHCASLDTPAESDMPDLFSTLQFGDYLRYIEPGSDSFKIVKVVSPDEIRDEWQAGNVVDIVFMENPDAILHLTRKEANERLTYRLEDSYNQELAESKPVEPTVVSTEPIVKSFPASDKIGVGAIITRDDPQTGTALLIVKEETETGWLVAHDKGVIDITCDAINSMYRPIHDGELVRHVQASQAYHLWPHTDDNKVDLWYPNGGETATPIVINRSQLVQYCTLSPAEAAKVQEAA